ncbi:site-specific integrase [Mycobacteroides abscessus]|uniref:site-specific integrase n=1 Tax=Mycobacteroides abscessus TaxID=36809 RepID=UPI000C2646D2|nr:site-specific integrase [Mycobacteroides abscessus]RIS55392.1 site-specific integrase [Mycobacteroides abscessus]
MARSQGESTRYPGIEKVVTPRFERGYGYRARADARAVGGGQPEKTFETVSEARDWQATAEAKVSDGTFIGKNPLTVSKAIEQWLDGQRGEQNTKSARQAALAPVVSALGDRRVQTITKQDVELLLRQLIDGDIEGVQKRSVTYTNVTRAKWSAVWKDLVAQGVLPRNVVELVQPFKANDVAPSDTPSGGSEDEIDIRRRLTNEEIRSLIDAHTPRVGTAKGRGERVRLRRGTFIELALLGLRRAELAGLRWSAIGDLDGEEPTLRVERTRVATASGTEEKRKGKTEAAKRTLLLPPEAVEVLRRHRDLQVGDRARSGKSWKGDADLAVLTKDNGTPLSPRALDAAWHEAMDAAGISGYRLHDTRHTAASRLLSAGVPLMDVATWLGHADGGVLALRVYGHTDPKDLGKAAAALGRP